MSLRLRLIIATGAVALAGLVVADVATWSALRSFLVTRIDDSLAAARAPLGHAPPPALVGQGGPARGPGSLGVVAPGQFVELRRADGTVVFSQAAHLPGGQRLVPELPAPGVTAGSTYLTVPSTTPGGPAFRLLVTTGPGTDELIVGAPLGDVDGTLVRLVLIEVIVTAAVLAVAVALSAWLIRVGLRPLRDVEAVAEEISAGRMDRRVPGSDRSTELGRLARALNVMLERIQGAFAERDATETRLRASEERMRRFVADASHELRTPLAAVSAYSELYERGAVAQPADLERAMRGIRTESARMADLVADLLLLARLDEGRPLERVPVDVTALVADAAHAATTVGPEWPVTLAVPEAVTVTGDPARLRQVVDNLLANVRAHPPPGTPVTVEVRRLGPVARLTVADNGPGMPPDVAGRAFERFSRADASRSRSSGGAGLGLAIVQAIVVALGGAVSLEVPEGGGTRVAVELPVAEDGP
ncbi:MAG: HAMP domain-containing sensor histidine kinase [Actinomycetota bacterium]|nr:HAMP domain-containing sensor histidine kinase [Actinomycetota bacterium]